MAENTVSTRRAQLPALTSLRFFAALHVVLHHFAWPQARADQSNYQNPLIGGLFNILNVGFLAVSFFFVLSGFILAYTYLDKAKDGLSSKSFYLARFARIYPAYFVSLLPGAKILLSLAKEFGIAFAVFYGGAKLAMLHTWFPSTSQGWNDPTWSLSVEALFYASFPFFATRIARIRADKVKPLLAIAFGAIVLLAVARQWVDSQGGDFDTIRYYFIRLPLSRLPEFLLGVLLGRWFMDRQAAGNTSSQSGTSVMGAIAACVAIMAMSGFIPPAFQTVALVPAIAWLLVSAARGGGWVSHFLAAPFMLLLGEASYSLYLIHGPVRAVFESLAHRFVDVTSDSIPLLLLYLVSAIAASILMHKCIEIPARNWIRNRFN